VFELVATVYVGRIPSYSTGVDIGSVFSPFVAFPHVRRWLYTTDIVYTLYSQHTIISLKQLTDLCQAVDQGLQHIKAETDRFKKNQVFTERYRARRHDYVLYQAFTEHNQSVKPAEVIQVPVCKRGSVL
jgi:hypothetical protein